MSRKTKSNLIKVEVRRNDIRKLMLEGKTTNYIVANMKHDYGVHRRTVERDITAIYAGLKDELSVTTENLKELHIARYENLYRFYMDRGTEDEPNFHFDPEKAAKMLEKKEKLLGINRSNDTILLQQNNLNVNIEHKKKIEKVIGDITDVEDLLKLSSLYNADGDEIGK